MWYPTHCSDPTKVRVNINARAVHTFRDQPSIIYISIQYNLYICIVYTIHKYKYNVQYYY
jgi:hypothetical protein